MPLPSFSSFGICCDILRDDGQPLVVIGLKKPGVPARAAFDENIMSYQRPQNGIPVPFAYNVLVMVSNATDSHA
jgi:type I restriction enzyme R subunit